MYLAMLIYARRNAQLNEHNHKINLNRLISTIQASAGLGTLANGGLGRLALSTEDKQMRDLFSQWMHDSRLKVRIDDFGNMYGRRAGINPNASPIVIGSHLDTQAIGGKYDGILGVLSALEIVRTLDDLNIKTERPIEIVNFTNEEGARFLPPMLGSGAVTDIFSANFISSIKDSSGKYFTEELEKIGYKGKAENRLKDIFCFIELHIEQGPILELNKTSIGAVTSIQGLSCFEVTLRGETSHAGTTPMENRIDVIKTGAKMIHEIYSFNESAPNTLFTVGKIEGYPNVTNSVAKKITFSVDIRHPQDDVRVLAEQDIKKILALIAKQNNVEMNVKQINDLKAEPFSQELIKLVEQKARKRNYSVQRLVSGAGHDSKYMNSIAPTTMIFIPSIGGVSHCEAEHSKTEDIEKGAQILFDITLDLANRSTIDNKKISGGTI